jgi:MFS family permease
MALFFSAATLAGAFGGILARGIAEMSGVGGKPAWAWIFILEGLLSILVSMAAYWCIYDYPATQVSLSLPQRQLVPYLDFTNFLPVHVSLPPKNALKSNIA